MGRSKPDQTTMTIFDRLALSSSRRRLPILGRMAAPFILPLRYPASCRLCGRRLQPGTKAWWDPTTHRATCISCDIRHPADPFERVDPALKGTPGGSAQAEHDRRAGRPDADAWLKGAVGERHLSALLHKESRKRRLVVLDDRRIPGTRANIDHIVIAPSGVYVIDTKNHTGRIERKAAKGSTERLLVKGWDRTEMITKVKWQTDAVRTALDGADAPVIPVLCFVNESNWGIFQPVFTIDGVHVLRPLPLRKLLRKKGTVNGGTRTECARLISIQLRPAFVQDERKAG